MTTNREKFEKVFSTQLALAKVSNGTYAPGKTDEECIKAFVVENHMTEEDAKILLQEKREEWLAHKGERVFYYFQRIQFGVEQHLEVLRVWENELINLFDTYEFTIEGESDLPFAMKKNG